MTHYKVLENFNVFLDVKDNLGCLFHTCCQKSSEICFADKKYFWVQHNETICLVGSPSKNSLQNFC